MAHLPSKVREAILYLVAGIVPESLKVLGEGAVCESFNPGTLTCAVVLYSGSHILVGTVTYDSIVGQVKYNARRLFRDGFRIRESIPKDQTQKLEKIRSALEADLYPLVGVWECVPFVPASPYISTCRLHPQRSSSPSKKRASCRHTAATKVTKSASILSSVRSLL